MKIVFHGNNAGTFRLGFEAYLEQAVGHDILTVSDDLKDPDDLSHFETADVIVGTTFGSGQPRPNSLRLYHVPGAGVESIKAELLPDGAHLCNCFGHEHAIAEYVMTALLQRVVPLADADARLRQGEWRYWAGRSDALRPELSGQTIGLLGFGHIGKAIAVRAKAFGMCIHVANRTRATENDIVDKAYALDELPAFMAATDAIVVSLPLNEATAGIVGEIEFSAMQSHAVIINVGRGPVINEQALFDALSDQSIGGAVIDTWYLYPAGADEKAEPSRLPFHQLDNVVMTPHMSGWTTGTVRRRQATIAENIRRLAGGEALLNQVN
ncbi:MAG: 2-hydroxyacid dehydrogenase [Pseudomonadota bacterium]